MKNYSIGFIGGGRITRIMLHAFANMHCEFKSISVCDINDEILTKLQSEFPSIHITKDAKKVANNELVVIALHPPVIIETLSELKDSFDRNSFVISLAPKISIERLLLSLGLPRIVRLIPNATSYINKGYNPITFSDGVTDQDKQSLLELLRALGYTFETDERKLESFAIISALLPTYFWFQWDELEKIGTTVGLEPKEAKEAIRQTLLAATQLFYNPDLTYDEVINLIPVKPVAEHEKLIRECFSNNLLPLFEKIKPVPLSD